MHARRSLICLLLVYASMAIAVETIIIGDITNATTGEPIPNVNIHFRGTQIGTTSDETGAYMLRVDLHKKLQLVFSAVGYHTQRFEIEPGTMSGLHVTLQERAPLLDEIAVTPDKNPAIPIIERVRKNRPINDRTLQSHSYPVHREKNLYVSHIQKKHLRRALWSSLQTGMIQQEDSSYIMPLYLETQSFQLVGQDMIPANDQHSQSIVLSSTDYSSLLDAEGNVNFYQATIPIMGHGFLSPLAISGEFYYRYYLTDSVVIDTPTGRKKLYTIRFRTRNPFHPTFNGEMLIDSATSALRSINANAPVQNSVNYLNELHISQTLASDNSLQEEHLSILLDFAIKTDQAGTVFPTLLLTNHITATSQHPSAPITPTVSTLAPQVAAGADTLFNRLDSLPIIRTAKWIATIATTGYIPTGTAVDFGHIGEIFQTTPQERFRLGLPFRTNEKMSRVVSLEAAVAYGFRDRQFKGLGRVSIDLPTPRLNQLFLEYNHGYSWSEVDDFDRLMRENDIGRKDMDLTSLLIKSFYRDSLCRNTAVMRKQLQFHWFADWSPNIETHAYIRAGWQPAHYSVSDQEMAYQSLSLIARLSWGERKYDGYFMRKYVYSSRYPVLYLGAEATHWGYQNQSSLFAHLRLMLTQHAQLGLGGTLEYALQMGAIFGTAPTTMLWHADANQSYAYDPYRFTLMHGEDILADKYIALHAEWDGQGILFNLIPGIRWLHLHELVEAKIAYGYCSDRHRAPLFNQQPQHFYAEVGVGIGNILRVCDLYSVWSLSPNIEWGIRFRVHLGL